MDLVTIIILGVGLAMDCFAVSVTQGICANKLRLRPALNMAFLFGFLQGVMPLIGFGVGQAFAAQIKAVDHWVAFGILAAIGGKMMYESLKSTPQEEEKCACNTNRFQFTTLLTLAFATSIDALATGLIFVPYPHKILFAAFVIGIISFIASMIGIKLGHQFGKKIPFNFELTGGIVLIFIGGKILFEHLSS